jgi:hypothetical protein
LISPNKLDRGGPGFYGCRGIGSAALTPRTTKQKEKSMIRNLKVLGLALVAVLALSASVASSAFAIEFHSDSLSGNTWLTGVSTGSHVTDAAGSTITCKKATVSGTQSGKTAASVDLNISYGECTVAIGEFNLAATVNMGGCQYSFNANGEVGVVNATGKTCSTEQITYRVSNFLGECDVKIGPQTGLKSVKYGGSTTVANGTIGVSVNITNIKGTSTGNLCSTTGEFTNGQYTSGPVTVSGFTDNSGAENAQTPIWVT